MELAYKVSIRKAFDRRIHLLYDSSGGLVPLIYVSRGLDIDTLYYSVVPERIYYRLSIYEYSHVRKINLALSIMTFVSHDRRMKDELNLQPPPTADEALHKRYLQRLEQLKPILDIPLAWPKKIDPIAEYNPYDKGWKIDRDEYKKLPQLLKLFIQRVKEVKSVEDVLRMLKTIERELKQVS